ncbi:hypothetical protein BH11PSE12_BH11PSE12_27200 [soil metagenome]
MASCINLEIQVDGSYKVTPDARTDLSACMYVLNTGEEVGNSLIGLTPAQGAEISAYIAALWAVAWGIKQIANVIKGTENHEES